MPSSWARRKMWAAAATSSRAIPWDSKRVMSSSESASGRPAGDHLSQLQDRAPVQQPGADWDDQVCALDHGLAHVVGDYYGAALHRRVVELPAVQGVGARGVDVHPRLKPVAQEHGIQRPDVGDGYGDVCPPDGLLRGGYRRDLYA